MLDTCGYIQVPVQATPQQTQNHYVNVDKIVCVRPSVNEPDTLCYIDVVGDYSVTAKLSCDEVKRLIMLAHHRHVRITGKTLDDPS